MDDDDLECSHEPVAVEELTTFLLKAHARYRCMQDIVTAMLERYYIYKRKV